MREVDVAIVGGGLAGSTATAMLGKAGCRVILIDPHASSPADFRCEKLDSPQARLLELTGLAEPVLRVATFDREVWVARFGRLLEKRPGDQYGILYADLVNSIRAQIPRCVEFIQGKVTAISTTSDRQRLGISDGSEISCRLVIMANGLNSGLRASLGMARHEWGPCHSISIGFDIKPANRPAFDFRALTYYGERVSDRAAYVTLFPIGSSMRANLFVYRDVRDPWLRQMREEPQQTFLSLMPNLPKIIGDFAVTGPIQVRPADLYVTQDHRQPGVVLVGDAFATSCPAAGTGARKVFIDVERLCHVYVPRWLATAGMGVEKIGAFYDDPLKRASDAYSHAKAVYMRAITVERGLPWRLRRWARFLARLGLGTLRRWRERWTAAPRRSAVEVPAKSA